MPKEITQEYLKSRLHYNPETGVFTWKASSNPHWNGKWDGKRAGWLKTGKSGVYRQIAIDNVKYYEHRLAWLYMTGEWPKEVDHINGNKICNKFCNLREASGSQNHYNKKMMSNNTSGYKGVFFCKQKKKWLARIQYNKTQKHLGTFECPTSAYFAYCKAAKELHGEFARFA